MKRGMRHCIFITVGGEKLFVTRHDEDVTPGTIKCWPEFSPLKRRAQLRRPEFIEQWREHYAALMPNFVFETELEITPLLPEHSQ